jgi:hypothetical protein
MKEPLRQICIHENFEYFKHLDKQTKILLVETCFTSLFLAKGNRRLAKNILSYLELIRQEDLTLVFNNNLDFPPYKELKMKGVTTIPIFSEVELKDLQQRLTQTTNYFPEYKRDPTNRELNLNGELLKYTLGGAAFLGNPSSFHNILVREIRLKTQEIINKVIFEPLLNNLNCKQNIQMLIDRLMIRNPGVKPSPESWHRDVAPKELLLDDDIIYGGWVNLDSKDQYFSCILGSHLDIKLRTLNSGFATIPKDEVKRIGKFKTKIKIPPGHLILFPQYILHEIVSSSKNYTMKRLFIGWRQTFSENFFYKDFVKRLETQAIMKLPSGQEPSMYAKLHLVFHKRLVEEWSESSIDERILIEDVDKEGNNILICPRFMHSLKHYNFQLYPSYTKEEIEKYKPQKVK